MFKSSILSIRTSLGFVLKDDLFKFNIKFLIWLISILFLSSAMSIEMKLGLDLFEINLNDLFSGLIVKFFYDY